MKIEYINKEQLDTIWRKQMKKILEKLKKYIKKIKRKIKKDKNKYYWKRKYYKIMGTEKKRNDQLAEDLRRMYTEVKKYQRLLKEKEGNNESNRVRSI